MNNPPVPTISGVIRKRLDEIEQRMYEGERQSDIVAQLNKEGIKVSLKDFRQLLSRARKARKKLEGRQSNITTVKPVRDNEVEPVQKPRPDTEPATTRQKEVETKTGGKMSLADIDNLLKNPLDLDNV